jgi:2-phospho-L-lactate transferase/gluconeogenesis factor (CofD/UPF0052 family)
MTISQDKLEKVIAAIRRHYEAQGISLEHLDDRQIELGVRQLAAAARESGMTSEEATEKMREAVVQLERSKAEKAAAAAAALDAEDADEGEAAPDA